MSDFIFFLASVAIVLLVYCYLRWRTVSAVDLAPSDSAQIINITSTNNSYDPMGDVLASLDLPQVQEILGDDLHADMGGYMQ